ncbi:MFS transporter [Paenibacillus psychroresistens]|uniref:MFS transporter n=1 Tax=Paenibacillus psychroresistens TaxID=1778678 RepID=A0A6B8RDV3_9BACL|nr:MFS transporter [Paenibacillus psychroresistens]QGQ94389.1 MFS transporter [Paenibacillus psychroresistens]
MFKHLSGNAKACLLYEPLFLLPYTLYVTYASVFMLALGVSEKGIGWITTFGLVLQIFTSMISGYLTDRMGRRNSLLVFDLLSISVGMLFLIFAQNIWFFIIAAALSSLNRIANTAWYCLLVEDSEPSKRHHIFNMLQLVGVIGGLFAPIGGWMVSEWTLIPAVRIMYVIAAISMTLMFIGRHYSTYNTEISNRKREDNKSMDWAAMIKEYTGVLRVIFANRSLLLIFCVYIMFQFQLTIKNTFLSVYLVQVLHFRDAFIAIFPAVTSAAMLLLMLFVVPRLNHERLNQYMIIGFIISAAAIVLQILLHDGQILLMIVSAVLSAVGTILTYPYLEAAVANTMDDDKRAGMLSILSVLILIFISPAGAIGGWSYSIDPRLPFLLIVAAFLLSALLMYFYKTKK